MTPGTHIRNLVVIITEAALEKTLEQEILALGAHGYTICDARGSGRHGRREARWESEHNIRVEVICEPGVADQLTRVISQKYAPDYATTVYVMEVGVLRPDKF
jgi:nitrogen regulatory protein P-II 2